MTFLLCTNHYVNIGCFLPLFSGAMVGHAQRCTVVKVTWRPPLQPYAQSGGMNINDNDWKKGRKRVLSPVVLRCTESLTICRRSTGVRGAFSCTGLLLFIFYFLKILLDM
jgi:hypothetical protein